MNNFVIYSSLCQGAFGLSKQEELEMAIETCKEMISTAPDNSERKKRLVKKLVELRIQLHELKVSYMKKKLLQSYFKNIFFRIDFFEISFSKSYSIARF